MSDTELFDLGELYRSVDATRLDRGLSWSAVSRRVGVAASTIRRFERAKDAEADGVLTLIAWLGDPPEKFLVDRPVPGEVLPSLHGGVIRVDSILLAGLSVPGRAIRPGGRTTIQRLVLIAQTHSRTVASLTRWSAV